jgi:hypothetical protein
MIARSTSDLLRLSLRGILRLWPFWLFWFAWNCCNDWWRAYLLTFPDRSTDAYALAFRSWPTVALLGPIFLMVVAIGAYRLHRAHWSTPIAGIAGVVIATDLTAWPECRTLAPYIGSAPLIHRIGATGGHPAYRQPGHRAGRRDRLPRSGGRRQSDDTTENRNGWAAHGARPIRQFRPCRLARHARRAPSFPGPG